MFCSRRMQLVAWAVTLPFALSATSRTRCEVAVTVSGLGFLDGDYASAGAFYFANHFNLDSDGSHLSKEDKELYSGRWFIYNFTEHCGIVDQGTPPCKVLAVCSSGCPSTENNDWPALGDFNNTKWEILNAAGGDVRTATATADCCPRKPQYCDAADNVQTCWYGKIGAAFGCPKFTQMQRECCAWTQLPIGYTCAKKDVPRVCDHGDVDGLEVALEQELYV